MRILQTRDRFGQEEARAPASISTSCCAPRSSASLPDSPTAVLQLPLFRMLWIATLVSNVGTWMQEVANSWLMTTIAPDPLMVSLVQAAAAMPMFLFGLPAGVLADLVDRRRWLLMTQTWMMLSAAAMAFCTLTGIMTPWLLLGLSFCLAVGAAFNCPGWHSVTPEIVPRDCLQSAVTLNGVVINCARAIGPALAGLVVVNLGIGAAFLLNAFSFLAVMFVLYGWNREERGESLPAEPFLSALRVGVQHVRHSPHLRPVVVRAGALVFNTSALWALLPLLSRQEFGLGARGYGFMLVANGLGAILGATVVLPRLRTRFRVNQIVDLGWFGFLPTLLVLSVATHFWVPFLAILWGGVCLICVLSSFHLAANEVVPDWVRARTMSIYLLIFFGATTLGSFFWGHLGRSLGLRECLVVAATLLTIGSLTSWLTPLRTDQQLDYEPAHCWPDPEVRIDVPLNHGPILVQVEYIISPEDAPRFLEAMERVRRLRYRSGVLRWDIYVEMERPHLYREVYMEETWAHHLRQHQRISRYEEEVAEKAYRFHKGPDRPRVTHMAVCGSLFPRR